MKMKNASFIICAICVAPLVVQAQQTLNDTTLTGTTDIQGPVRIDDSSAPEPWGTVPTSFYWNLRLEDGLFVYGDGNGTQSLLNLDFDGTEGPLMLWYPEKAAFRAGSPGPWAWDETNIADHSFAFGDGAAARGDHSIVFGKFSETESDYSVGIGFTAEIWDAMGSVALGYQAYLEEADYSVAIGHGAEVWYSTNAIVMGYNADADEANYAVAIGRHASVDAESAVALGDQAYANHYKSIVLGRGEQIAGNSYSWVETDPLFILGNTGGTHGSGNAIVTLKNGQTTVTNKHWDGGSPNAVPAHVDASGGTALVVEGHTELKGNLILSDGTPLSTAQEVLDLVSPSGDFAAEKVTTSSSASIGGDLVLDYSDVAGFSQLIIDGNETIGVGDYSKAFVYLRDGGQKLGIDPNQIHSSINGSLSIINDSSSGSIRLRVGDSSSGLFIDSLQNVGVGTETPEEKLHVAGSAKVEGDVTLGGTVTLAQVHGDISMGIYGN